MGSVNVAIIGVGNCASSLVQGVHYYREAKQDELIPGLMHTVLGGYHISDINFVAAFDIDKNKVGKDLSKAIYSPPNNTFKFCDVPKTGVKVERGMTHDGLGKYLSLNGDDAEILMKYAEAQLKITPLKRSNINQATNAYRRVLRLDETFEII